MKKNKQWEKEKQKSSYICVPLKYVNSNWISRREEHFELT